MMWKCSGSYFKIINCKKLYKCFSIFEGMKRLLLTGLVAFVLANGKGLSAEDIGSCFPEQRVRLVIEEIPYHFSGTGKPHVYLIRYAPESQNGYMKGGRLTVYMPSEDDSSYEEDTGIIFIFDRTDKDPSKWYCVSNSLEHIGCADEGIYLIPAMKGAKLSKENSQKRFNEVMEDIEDLIGVE